MATFLSPLSIYLLRPIILWFDFGWCSDLFFFLFSNFPRLFHAILDFDYYFLFSHSKFKFLCKIVHEIRSLLLLRTTFIIFFHFYINIRPDYPLLRTDHVPLLLFSLSETDPPTMTLLRIPIGTTHSQGTYQHRIEGTVHTCRWCIAEHGRFQV